MYGVYLQITNATYTSISRTHKRFYLEIAGNVLSRKMSLLLRYYALQLLFFLFFSSAWLAFHNGCNTQCTLITPSVSTLSALDATKMSRWTFTRALDAAYGYRNECPVLEKIWHSVIVFVVEIESWIFIEARMSMSPSWIVKKHRSVPAASTVLYKHSSRVFESFCHVCREITRPLFVATWKTLALWTLPAVRYRENYATWVSVVRETSV